MPLLILHLCMPFTVVLYCLPLLLLSATFVAFHYGFAVPFILLFADLAASNDCRTSAAFASLTHSHFHYHGKHEEYQ